MTEYVTARRPWTAAEIAALKRDLETHDPIRHLTRVPPVWRTRARCDLDLETYLLADLLGITEAQLMAWEEDPNLLPSPENEMYRRFIACSSGFADVLRPPERVGLYDKADAARWARQRAKHAPRNPLKSDSDTHVVG